MANNGSFSVVCGDYGRVVFSWGEVVNSSSNSSEIIWQITSTAGTKQFAVISNLIAKIEGTDVCNVSHNTAFGDNSIVYSGSKTITHDVDGSKTFYAGLSVTVRDVSSPTNPQSFFYSNYAGFNLTSITRPAYISYASNFNDEENPTINYYNPMGDSVSKVEACIASIDGNTTYVSYRQVPIMGNSYTFNLTETERNNLRNACIDSKTLQVKFYLRTTYNGSYYYSTTTKTLTIINAAPTGLSLTLQDYNSATTAVTLNNHVFVKGYSSAVCRIYGSAQKGANIARYELKNGSQVKYSRESTVSKVDSGVFEYSITDSRGYKTTKSDTYILVDYFPVTCNQKVTISLVGETGAKINVKLTGDYFNRRFDAGLYNTLDLEYRLKADSGAWGDWVNLTDTLTPTFSEDNDKYSLSFNIEDLYYETTYTIQCRAIDKLDSAQTSEYVAKLIPVFDWGKNDFKFNVPVDFAGGFKTPSQIASALGIQTGTASISWTATGSYFTKNVTFPQPFSKVPKVIIGQVFNSANILVSNITTTGFTAEVANSFGSSGSRSFSYIATTI